MTPQLLFSFLQISVCISFTNLIKPGFLVLKPKPVDLLFGVHPALVVPSSKNFSRFQRTNFLTAADITPFAETSFSEELTPLQKVAHKMLLTRSLPTAGYEIVTAILPYIPDYEEFIEKLKTWKYVSPELLSFENHHILPEHAGGTHDPSNMIRLSVEDHTLAHLFRYFKYEQEGDFLAFLVRCSTNNERKLLFIKRRDERLKFNRENSLYFHNSDWQRTQGRKGGRKGGLANTSKQYEARQKVGRKNGPIVGKKNQSDKLKVLLEQERKWYHKSGVFVITPPCETFVDLVQILEKAVPGEIRNLACFYKLLYGTKANLYGWLCFFRIKKQR